MAVQVTAEIAGQNAQGYEGMLAALAEQLVAAPGLILHTAHATEGGWRVIELWHTKAQADQFYARYVAPALPPGIRPKRTTVSLHCLVFAQDRYFDADSASPRSGRGADIESALRADIDRNVVPTSPEYAARAR